MTIRAYSNGKFRAILTKKGKEIDAHTFNTKEEAESWLKHKRSDQLYLESKAVYDSIPDLSFKDAVEKYFDHSGFQDKRPSTQKGERTKAKSLIKYFGELSVSKISSEAIQDYFDYRRKQSSYFNDNKTVRNSKISPETLRLEKAFLSNLYKFLNKRTTKHNPIKNTHFDLPRIKEDAEVIKIKDLSLLLGETAKFKNPDIFNDWLNFTLNTAMRPGESSRLLIEFYERENKGFNIPAYAHKNNRAHFVNLDDDTINSVEKQIAKAVEANSPYLFFSFSKKGQPIPFNYSHYWKKAKKAVGITYRLRPHQIRHTSITEYARHAKCTESELMLLTGHVSAVSLRRYNHRGASELRANAINVANEIEFKVVKHFLESHGFTPPANASEVWKKDNS